MVKYPLFCFLCFLYAPLAFGTDRPNIIIILVDDMGFSDIGSYGGEIETPNLDQLAAEGVKFSNFYNNARCCPTRASLMTGLYPHETGIGHMTIPRYNKRPTHSGYLGHLNRDCMTIAEVLQGAGYATMMTGKWHLGEGNHRDLWPLQRGFEQFYGRLDGSFNFFTPKDIKLGNENVPELKSTTDRRYYTTDAFTDYAIEFLDNEHQDQGRPFFLYLAYNAPHWPLHAHDEDVEKYIGKYMQGWEPIQTQRLERQKASGLIDANLDLSKQPEKLPDWNRLSPEKQKDLDRRMAFYAAMVDRVDQNIGNLIESLKASDQYDNTLILFLSDNGGCHEGGRLGGGTDPFDKEAWEAQGRHHASYGGAWASASNTPFRKSKVFTHEGGIATPFIAHWPDRIAPQEGWYRTASSIIDIAPTIYELAGAEYPEEHKGNAIHPLRGISLVPAFAGESIARAEPIFIEHESHAALISGDYKLVGTSVVMEDGVEREKWELYNIAQDRGEQNNLASQMPELLESMEQQWMKIAQDSLVYPRPPKRKKK